MELAEALGIIEKGPTGPTVGAFFDFEGTVVHGFSALPYFLDSVRANTLTRPELAETMLTGLRGTKSEAEFERFRSVVSRSWRGHSEQELGEIGHQVFEKKIAGHIYPEAWQLIRAHERAGHTVVITSSVSKFQTAPAAAELGVSDVLTTRLAAENGTLTGEIDGAPLRHRAKADAVRDFAEANELDPARSYAYAGSTEDIEFLSTVGNPVAVNPEHKLTAYAAEQGWPTAIFRPRGLAGPLRAARTAAAFGGFFGGITAGAVAAAPTRNHRAVVDRMIAYGGDLTLKGAGINVHVVGEHNAESPRPAVFIFNHQSELDMTVLAKVLRHGFTGITKKELATRPLIGPVLRFAGATFVDRSNSTQARQALAPVVDTIRGGTSIVIAPEGTRSLTPTMGPFKKGAFHIAMQAEVPIIPIVIRNAGELYWKNAKTVRSGRIDIAVLDPVDVSSWTVEDLDERINQVHRLFHDTLTHWPADR